MSRIAGSDTVVLVLCPDSQEQSSERLCLNGGRFGVFADDANIGPITRERRIMIHEHLLMSCFAQTKNPPTVYVPK